MNRFQYQIDWWFFNADDGDVLLLEHLNKRGDEGWELCAQGPSGRLVFRRQLVAKRVVGTQPPPKYFDAFWGLYPAGRRVGKKQALHKWQVDKLDEHWPVIEQHLTLAIPAWRADSWKYVPLVSTYLNQERWKVVEEEAHHKII
jgi:hypothetical protein